ncbi:hypothetical protein [Streptomyces sp. NPDC059909]|uniref:hypothetical protein n=1 Tax=Streptomyces sp. NPDC059909 TaxID=3346998 RepID=UPI003663ECE7
MHHVWIGGGTQVVGEQGELDDIDPAWCPSWPIAWQRYFHLARTHLAGGGTLPEESGLLILQGEDIGHWAQTQRAGWDTLVPAQQWLLPGSRSALTNSKAAG